MDDTYTNAPTPSSTGDAESVVTTATTPRAKFPSDLKTLACTWPGCPKTFNRPARLRDHLNSHTNSRPFKCPYPDCDKDYIEDKHLKQHIKGSHTLERKHVCQRDGCGKTFATGTRLKRHQAVHDGADRFRCQDCGQSFRKRDTLNVHVRKEHLNVRPFQCSEQGCDAGFDTKASLRRHRDKEHGEARFWCAECPVKENGKDDDDTSRVGFTTEALLLAHMKQEHQNCMFCDFKSSSKWAMEEHVEVHHSGRTVEERKTVLCPYDDCDKSFTKKANLKTHIRSAHEGFRFVCGEASVSGTDFDAWTHDQGCGDKFSSKARLEDHIRFKHLGFVRPKLSQVEQPTVDPLDEISGAAVSKNMIVCAACNEPFLRQYDLELHVVRHHGGQDASTPIHAGIDLAALGISQEDSLWPVDDAPEENIFASAMDFDQPRDEWAEDEANILLLARDEGLEANIDPALSHM
ncbi:putative C2H2 transcription factor [Sarocladium strictum]